MTKFNQDTSATQRYVQPHEQHSHVRPQRLSQRRYQQRRNQRNLWLIIVASLIVVVVVFIAALTFLSQRSSQQTTQSATNDVFRQVTMLSPDLLRTVAGGSATSGVNQTLKAVRSTPVLQGPTGKPEVFYMGAEYCPFCGAQRWALTIALSRFGSFEKPLTPILSAEDNVPTYSFYHSSYHSDYIDFVSVETGDNVFPDPNPLEDLTPDQQRIVNVYDAPPYVDAQSKGSFPFLSVGNQYVTTGAYYQPTLLVGNDYGQILTALKDPTSDTSRAVLGSVNYLTAQICEITGNKPASVCDASVQSLQQRLPKTTALK